MSVEVDGVQALVEHLIQNGSAQESWMDMCAERLAGFADPLTAILAHFETLTQDCRETLFDGSHDTSTHYKWLLARSQSPRFTLWLHEYKEVRQRTVGYAQVPHDHRYDIVSLILTGGYTAALWESSPTVLAQAGSETFGETDVMRLGHTAIHSLTDIRPGTLTLVVEGPRRKPYSTAYYPPAGDARTFPDFPARWPGLRGKLAAD